MPETFSHDERISGADGVMLHVVREGVGAPVILLHGFPENWRSWRHQIRPLVEAGFSVWAMDLRGYNRSDKPLGKAPYHLRLLVEDVAAVVRATGALRAHIVGHDWGGVIAWTFAGVHPELVARLVILNAPHMHIYLRKVWCPRQALRSLYVLFFQISALPELVLRFRKFALIRTLFRVTPVRLDTFTREHIWEYIDSLALPGALTSALNYYRANFARDALRFASRARIDAETLVIWGECDVALSTRLLDGLDRVAPRVRIHRIRHAGHWVQNEAPDEVNRVLTRFLLAPP